jgi:hypothetical protein
MNDQSKEKDLRSQQIEARKKRARELNMPLPRVRVTAASEEMRRALKHPSGMRFPEGGGSVEWPRDKFTRRRIKEGAVTVEEQKDGAEKKERPSRRAQSSAESPA